MLVYCYCNDVLRFRKYHSLKQAVDSSTAMTSSGNKRLTDVESVECVSDEDSSSHVVNLAVDLESADAPDEPAKHPGPRRHDAGIGMTAEKQLVAELHLTEQTLQQRNAQREI